MLGQLQWEVVVSDDDDVNDGVGDDDHLDDDGEGDGDGQVLCQLQEKSSSLIINITIVGISSHHPKSSRQSEK